MREGERDPHAKGGHDRAFRPAKDLQRRVKSEFERVDIPAVSPKTFKDSEGQVITGPRNFLTSPPKKGQVGKG